LRSIGVEQLLERKLIILSNFLSLNGVILGSRELITKYGTSKLHAATIVVNQSPIKFTIGRFLP
jgi:hypothetical protein